MFNKHVIFQPKLRSVLSSLTLPMRNIGLLFVYTVAPFISYYPLIILSAVAPALFLVLSPWMRESPYFLVSKGKKEKAKKSMSWLRGGITEDTCIKEINIIQVKWKIIVLLICHTHTYTNTHTQDSHWL